jgi:lysozyme
MRNKALLGAAFTAALSGLVTLEGMRTTAYLDVVGVPTICAGTTRGVKLGDTKTLAQCWTLAEAEFREYEKVVLDNIVVPIQPNVQAALVFFCVNVGKAGCKGSTTFRKINAGDTVGGCHALRMWNKGTIKGKKVVIPGLDNRRKAEESLCLNPEQLFRYSR